jgi:hypothetical protein
VASGHHREAGSGVNGWLFVAGVYVGATVIFSSVFLLLRILAWVLNHGLPNMLRLRARAVVEWQDCDEPAYDDSPDDIDALVDAINEDREKEMFAAWEAQFGERAS